MRFARIAGLLHKCVVPLRPSAQTLWRDADDPLRLSSAAFFCIALSSAVELEYHLLLAHDVGYVPDRRYSTLRSATLEVKRMLTGVLKRIEEHR